MDNAVQDALSPFQFTDTEIAELRAMAADIANDPIKERMMAQQTLELQRANLENRLARLTDVFVDGAIERSLFEEKRAYLLLERKDLEHREAQFADMSTGTANDLSKKLELLIAAPLSYKNGLLDEKREMLDYVTSNLYADRKNIAVELRSPFLEAANLTSVLTGGPVRHEPRTSWRSCFLS